MQIEILKKLILNNEKFMSNLIKNIYRCYPPSIIDIIEENDDMFLYFLVSFEDFTFEEKIDIKDFTNDLLLFLKFYQLNLNIYNTVEIKKHKKLFNLNIKNEKEFLKKYNKEKINKINQYILETNEEYLNNIKNFEKYDIEYKTLFILLETSAFAIKEFSDSYYIGNKQHKEILKKENEELKNFKNKKNNISNQEIQNINFGF